MHASQCPAARQISALRFLGDRPPATGLWGQKVREKGQIEQPTGWATSRHVAQSRGDWKILRREHILVLQKQSSGADAGAQAG
jgi:hypothetical protein